MNPARLLEHFDRLIDTREAVPRLRRFILDLAVRGKLVEQDSKDEPAGELLRRIKKEKARLIGAGQIKKQDIDNVAAENDQPFDLPNGWSLCLLGHVATCLDFRRVPINSEERTKRIAGKMPEELYPYYGATQQQGWIDEYIFDEEIILLGEDGVPFLEPLRPKAYLVSGKSWVNNHAHVFRGILVSNRFLIHWLNVFDYSGRVAGATRSKLNQSRAVDIPVPLPPLAEQNRIVEKVDELLALCDELEAAQTKREKRRDRLVAATLHGLNNGDATPTPDTPSTFEESARFYFNHLPRLTTRPEHIHQLRQTILNLAVRGKLVPQMPDDEPPPKPSGCLADRESRRPEEEPAESDIGAELGAERDRPFVIPATWRWVRVADVAEARLGKMLDKAKNKGTPRPYLRNVSVRWFDFDLSDLLEMNFEDSELEEFALRAGDVLICEGGEPGRAAVWDERASGIYFQKAIHRIRFVGPVMPIFFVRVLRHDAISGRLETYFTGVGIKHLTGKGLARYTFPLPPLPEQRRIMAKVGELMALCDELEAGLARSHDLCGSSLAASLSQTLAS